MSDTYRDFTIEYDPPPVPFRTHDWCAVTDDYEDGDEMVGQVLYAGSREELIQLIDEWHTENESEGL